MQKLERLNSSIDIIPLQVQQQQQANVMDGRRPGTSGVLPTTTGLIVKPTMDKSRQVDNLTRDPMIISRVKSYLYENEDKVYIDVTEMADHLQRKYRDYRNKKRAPFRIMVRRAYDEITENLTRQADSHWQDDDDDIDIEVDAIAPEYAQYKSQMANKQNGNSSDKELIDISSDDDGQTATKTLPSYKISERESMEIEPSHAAKRPHLSPSIEQYRSAPSQSREVTSAAQPKSRLEKSRKRPREKDDESPLEPLLKKKAKDFPVTNSTLKFSDIGGNNKVLETIVNLLLHLKHPEVYTNLGISPPRGFLLHGPPGCGKTLLAHAIAGELKIPLLKVAAPELISGVSGESEQRIRDLFDQAISIAPCILFLDEIDAVISDRATAQRGMEKRIVSQLLLCLDELNLKDSGSKVLVLGATNRPESLDPALRRAGRFDREVSLGIPDKDARAAILRVHTTKVQLSEEVSLQKIATLTPGFVGADLVALIREAAMVAVNRALHNFKKNAAESKKDDADVSEIVIEEEKKKEPTPEQDISDVIIEDDEPVAAVADVAEVADAADNSDIAEITEQTETTAEVESASSTTVEEPKKADESSEAQPSSESVPNEASLVATSTPLETAEPTEAPPAPTDNVSTATPEITEATKPTTDEPIDSSDNATSVVTAPTVAEPVEVEEEPVEQQVQVEEPKCKLDDLLGWLHDDPPLSAEQLALIRVEDHDFEAALKTVQPSAKREGFATVPDVTWNDIGSLQDIRQELQMTILAPIRYSEQFARLGLTTPSGVLLCGPPGCGKTLLAKAIANEAGINFISVKGPELLNMYVGESEKAVRQCFIRARNSTPCVIFFDELDALCPKRSDGDSNATARVVNQMLTEMDGVEGRKDVFLMAASNRPDIIDPAVLRPGRLDKILYVGLPNSSDRVDILQALTKNGTKPKLSTEVDLEEIANDDRCNGLTGADLAALVKEAGNEVLREIINGLNVPEEICPRHIYAAFDKVRPSVREKDLRHYEILQKLYSVKRSQNTDVLMSLAPPIDTTMEAMET